MPAKNIEQFRLNPQYVAGLFDGEGHVSIRQNLKGMQVGITNGNKQILKDLQHQYGGRVESIKRYNPKHSLMWHWIITKRDEFIRFFDDVDLLVKIKQPQVFAGECFCTTMLECGGNRRKEQLSNLAWAVRREALGNLRSSNRAR